MDKYWSTLVQGTEALDLDRERRIRDDKKELFLNALRLKDGMKILDVGCGPGTLTRKLSKWLGPYTEIFGLDRDVNFIEYAKNKAEGQEYKNIKYIVGDALNLPFGDNSMDAVTSFTVINFLPNKEFLLEQKRVCKSGGVVSVVNVAQGKGIFSKADCLYQTSREKELWYPLLKAWEEKEEDNDIRSYEVKHKDLPLLFDELGFKNISMDAIALPVVIDDYKNSLQEKLMIIEADRKNDLEVLQLGLNNFPGLLSRDYIKELRDLIDKRYAKRVELVKKGKKIWDFKVSYTLIVSGEKP